MKTSTSFFSVIGVIILAIVLQSNSCNKQKEKDREAKKDTISAGLLKDAEAELLAIHIRDSLQKDSIAKANAAIDQAQNQHDKERPHPNGLPLEPTYKEGRDALAKFISGNLVMPKAAKEKNISGMVYVDCMIMKDGSITKLKVRQGLGYGCDEEAVRIIKLMPNWEPGRANGQAIDMEYMIMIPFNMQK